MMNGRLLEGHGFSRPVSGTQSDPALAAGVCPRSSYLYTPSLALPRSLTLHYSLKFKLTGVTDNEDRRFGVGPVTSVSRPTTSNVT